MPTNPTRDILFPVFKKAGKISRENPLLGRLSKATGLSKETILRACLYDRQVSLASAMAIAEKLKVKGISANSFRIAE